MRNLTSLKKEDEVNRASLRIFWKIIVEGNGDSLRVVKELSLWGEVIRKDEGDFNCRLLWKQIPLQVEIGPPLKGGRHRDQALISVEDGYIHFKGGYLKIYDTSLVEDVRVWGGELDPTTAVSTAVAGLEDGNKPIMAIKDYFAAIKGVPDFEDYKQEKERPPESIAAAGNRPSYYAGYNVRLEVELAPERGDRVTSHPIFFYPQDPEDLNIGHVALEVTKTADRHKLRWDISTDSHTPKEYLLEEFHTLTVNQESDGADKPKFEFLVDTIPLGKEGNKNSHLFSKCGRFFFVGKFPDYYERTREPFRGYIKRLMFDPNASCTSC